MTQRWTRLTGICATLGALVFATGDILMHGIPATVADFPSLAPYADTVGDMVLMLAPSELRFFVGSFAILLLAPLELAAAFHLYRALRPAGRLHALVPSALLLWMAALVPLVHGSFYYLGEALRALAAAEPSAQEAALALVERFQFALFFLYIPILVGFLVGWLWATVLIARGRTLYPRWMALFNPVLLMFVFAGIGKVVPGSVGDALYAAFTNLGGVVFFALSTRLLWDNES